MSWWWRKLLGKKATKAAPVKPDYTKQIEEAKKRRLEQRRVLNERRTYNDYPTSSSSSYRDDINDVLMAVAATAILADSMSNDTSTSWSPSDSSSSSDWSGGGGDSGGGGSSGEW